MRTPITLLFILISAPALSGAPLSGEAFNDYTLGKTLYFSEAGQAYGAERYLPNRRVEWSFLDGDCKEGEWYAQDKAICFVYEDRPEPQCWQFELTARGLRATFMDDGQSTDLYEAQQSDEPMHCIGPEIGV
ncbi:hypothetical protein [Planktotalea sp.]|uniref:hypothetical protein n=1 Tax=Planktotalea sp. TaxID=2029877 RepID=UPI0025FFD1A8|nr:hypothetical protein [Planktotalea sp.]